MKTVEKLKTETIDNEVMLKKTFEKGETLIRRKKTIPTNKIHHAMKSTPKQLNKEG